ncbi:MAG TPA: hypothetical protein VK034_05380, partial [Enhygromyxa sp.]|nr:hypothetical protein [Enhygromyxa sp.]
RYDRALSWCPERNRGQSIATEETFIDLARLADGSLLIVGRETGNHLDNNYSWSEQPIVIHASAEGEVLATDRGFWRGEAVAAAADDDGSAYVLMYAYDGSDQQLHVRKYAP